MTTQNQCPNCGEPFHMINTVNGYCVHCEEHYKLDDIVNKSSDYALSGSAYQQLVRENTKLMLSAQKLAVIIEMAEPLLHDYNRLLSALEALRQIPSWASILLATDDPPPKYIVRIMEGDVGGDEILSVGGDNLIAVLEEAHAQYLLWNREYARKLAGIAWGERKLTELGLLDIVEDENTSGGEA